MLILIIIIDFLNLFLDNEFTSFFIVKNTKTQKENKMKKIIKGVSIALTSAAIVALPVFSASALDSNTTINAQINSVISVTSTPTVSLTVTPVAAGARMSSAQGTVTVGTNNASGYNLKIAMQTATRDLVNGSNTIAAHTGTKTAPSNLADNTWGYRVDGVGTFGSGTTAESNVASSSKTWAGVPASGGGDEIKNTSTPASGDATTVWFGVSATSTKPNGTYTGTVVYTAITN